jgi:hypothetical protein
MKKDGWCPDTNFWSSYERLDRVFFKGNNLHSTVNLCPGNGLVITRYILVGQKGSQGKSKLSLWRKLRMFLSLAINHRFGFGLFLLGIKQKNSVGAFLARNRAKIVLVLDISHPRNLSKRFFWFEHFSRSESIQTNLVWTFLSLGINIKQLWFEYFSLGIMSQNKFGLNVSRSESHPYLGYIFFWFYCKIAMELTKVLFLFFFQAQRMGVFSTQNWALNYAHNSLLLPTLENQIILQLAAKLS